MISQYAAPTRRSAVCFSSFAGSHNVRVDGREQFPARMPDTRIPLRARTLVLLLEESHLPRVHVLAEDIRGVVGRSVVDTTIPKSR